ncbi:probable jasmonic acid carboxyl methyltransferase 2 [Mercurialis annua]|uniref:probable jasmonic acid carboxyl methyltransferase 2 n=1 Tax=Mercurialis annua TaxID=3986 RepID=UPI00215F377A|nr:probable jasmonic acid carboxyl methyltransferase 2 [Mercurialis annua]
MESVKEKGEDRIQLEKVLHMNAGDGNNSYANNSLLQKKVMLKAKPILQESITKLCTKNSPDCIKMADMGCSSGPNTFVPIWEIIDAIDDTCNRLKRKPPVLQVFLNDLPTNDFNLISMSLPSFYKKLEEEKGGEFGACFIAAVPGNFYGRLFPPKSLHFVHSSYSLHWFSQVPKIPLNKGHIYLAKTSPANVHKAYLGQFERDLETFLRCRSEEMVHEGRMVLTFYGRDDMNMYKSNTYKPNIWELFGTLLNDMVLEGLIEETKLDTFNIPFYGASAQEVKNVIESEGSFTINRFESFQIGWDAGIDDRYKNSIDKYTKGAYIADRIRAVSESILSNHFGDKLIDIMFQRFSVRIGEYMEMENGAYTNHVVSMTCNK